MLIKLSNLDLVSLYEGLQEVKTKTIPIEIGFLMVKNMKILEPIYQAIIESRTGLLTQVGEIQADGSIKIPQDKIQETNSQLAQLSSIENTLDLSLIKLSALKEASWTLEEIMNIYPIIKEDSEG